MSMDKSLKSRSVLERHRNVLTRAERIARLKDAGSWTDDTARPYGLPKVAHRKVAVGKKGKAEKKADAAAGTTAEPAAEAAKPAEKEKEKPKGKEKG
ncbi:MAG: small basic protein [Planctomycetes bacterium]|nr:small basic protein [Planctomycetota bacterium]